LMSGTMKSKSGSRQLMTPKIRHDVYDMPDEKPCTQTPSNRPAPISNGMV
jgi:hypothetical protein